jgi:polyisoprenyl-phosphate glycosyltransferase
MTPLTMGLLKNHSDLLATCFYAKSYFMNQILSLVIPCYNEEHSIEHVLGNINSAKSDLIKEGLVKDVEIIVVNDGSKDRTPEILNQYEFIKVIKHDYPQGYGSALKDGFRFSRGEWIGFLDMDKTYDPVDLRPLLQIVQSRSCQIVFGSRFENNTGMPLLRWVGNAFFAACIQVLYFRKITDACTGFRIFHRSLLPQILNLPQHNLNYSIAMTLMCLNNKVSFQEFSIRYWEREGKSKLNEFKDGVDFLKTIFQFWWQMIKGHYFTQQR